MQAGPSQTYRRRRRERIFLSCARQRHPARKFLQLCRACMLYDTIPFAYAACVYSRYSCRTSLVEDRITYVNGKTTMHNAHRRQNINSKRRTCEPLPDQQVCHATAPSVQVSGAHAVKCELHVHVDDRAPSRSSLLLPRPLMPTQTSTLVPFNMHSVVQLHKSATSFDTNGRCSEIHLWCPPAPRARAQQPYCHARPTCTVPAHIVPQPPFPTWRRPLRRVSHLGCSPHGCLGSTMSQHMPK